MTVVIADTSPLNYLVLVRVVEILRALYGRVMIPEPVLAELSDEGAPREVRAWIATRPGWIEVRPAPLSSDPELADLDPGEQAAITLAQRYQEVLLLIDDVPGRAAASKRNIPTVGTLGVLRAAALRGLIDLAPVLARLGTTNFRVSKALIEELLAEDRERQAELPASCEGDRCNWEPYDPAWLVELAKDQMPEEPWLPAALATCRRAWLQSPAYVYFVNPRNPNSPGSEWQFEANVVLKHPTEGDLVLDILKDRRVGGVEFLSRVLA